MALDKPSHKAAVKAAFLAAATVTDPDDFDQAMDDLATAITNSDDTFIKSGTVNNTGTTASACTAGGAAGTCVSSGGVT